MRTTTVSCLAALAGFTVATAAQESPYVPIQARSLKALSTEEVTGYLEGRGMGLALAAELNGYPGPRHVLELADSLGLDAPRRRQIQAVHDRMHTAAVRLGTAIVGAETTLDSIFAAHQVSDGMLEQHLMRIATLQGELRYVHLSAHLEVTKLLSVHERHEYMRLRGYATDHKRPHSGHGKHE